MEVSTPDQDVIWDFRQFYVDWGKVYLGQFTTAHLKDDYPKMLDALEKFHPILWGRAISKDFELGYIDETFKEIISNIIELSNDPKYLKTYRAKERNPEAVTKLNEAFNIGIMYLVWLMKKHKMFGSSSVNRGL